MGDHGHTGARREWVSARPTSGRRASWLREWPRSSVRALFDLWTPYEARQGLLAAPPEAKHALICRTLVTHPWTRDTERARVKGRKKMRQRARAKPAAQPPLDCPVLPTSGSSRCLAPDGPCTVWGKVKIADTQGDSAGTPGVCRLLGDWPRRVSLAVMSVHQMVLSPRGNRRADSSKRGHASNSELTEGLGS